MKIDFRQHIERIIPLTDEEYAFIISHFTTRDLKKNEFVFQQGERVRYAYFVLSGLLALIYDDEAGKQHIVSFAMEDWWETDYQALYKKTNATMSVQCLENTSLLCLSLDKYNSLCAAMPKMEHFFLVKANGGHIGSQQRILSFLTSDAKNRYEQLLNKYPSLFQRVSKTLLASYLGVSRETLSRLSS